MTTPVETLLTFHSTRSFGSRANMRERQREAGGLYAALTEAQVAELAEAVLSAAGDGGDAAAAALCCLACFRPGSLAPFHAELVRRRILYSGVL